MSLYFIFIYISARQVIQSSADASTVLSLLGPVAWKMMVSNFFIFSFNHSLVMWVLTNFLLNWVSITCGPMAFCLHNCNLAQGWWSLISIGLSNWIGNIVNLQKQSYLLAHTLKMLRDILFYSGEIISWDFCFILNI